MSDSRREVARVLREGNDFLVASHENPDGDALGSTLAVGYLLRALDKRFMLYNPSGVPEHFAWLRKPGPFYSSLSDLPGFTPRWVVVLDCADPFRIGKELLKAIEPETIVNIDHHSGNPMFGVVNWVDTTMAAVGEMVALLAQDLDVPLSGGLGENVYLAIASDTGSFSYGNTKPETLELAAAITRQGLDIGAFNAKYQNQWKFKRIRFWAEVLGESSMHLDNRVAIVRVPLDSMRRHEVGPEECDGLVEFMRRVKSARVSISLREEVPGMIKFSLRSHGSDNVQQVARHFGGGGHRNAAGGTIAESMARAQELILKTIEQRIDLDAENFSEQDDA